MMRKVYFNNALLIKILINYYLYFNNTKIQGYDKKFDFMKESLLLDQNSMELLNDNQKKIIESLLSDRDLIKFLENKISNAQLVNIEKDNKSKNILENNLLKIEQSITKDKIENFKENITHLFNSYNNDLEVPKLEKVN